MKNSFLKKCMGILLMLMISICVNAQVKVTGTVIDGTGEPLPGVSVVQSGNAKNGTITDMDGKYSINVPGDAKIGFSFVGYKPVVAPVNGKRVIDIVLDDDTQALEDLVVVGYGTMKKSDISGSVATVNMEQLERKVPTNIAQALQGAAAGVMVTAQDGAPGTQSAIRIRGIGTVNGDAQPLYVVDGVQVGTNADFVNPSDIESIEILKDASATAIYGSAGANGVIMITTKHGQKGSFNINVTADFGIQTLPYKIKTLQGDDYARSIRESKANDGATLSNQIWSEAYDGKRNLIDWQDQMYRTSLKQQYGISASGGTDKTQYNFSLGYLNNDGIIVNTNYDRLTARAGVKSKVNDYIEFGGDMNYMYSSVKGNNIGLGNNQNLSSQRDIAQMAPSLDYIDDATGNHILVNAVNPDGTYGASKAPTPDGWEGMTAAAQNPYATQMEIGRKTHHSRVSINPYIDVTLLNLKHHKLNVHAIANWTQSTSDNDEMAGCFERYNMIGGKMTQVKYEGRNAEFYSFGLGQSKDLTKGIETYLTYKWETDFNTLTLMAGNSVSEYEGSWVSASANKFLSPDNLNTSLAIDKSSITGGGGFNAEIRTISYYGRLVYSLFDRYILTGTIRRDGSSNFASSHRWGTFPSAALAWRIKEESFLKDVDAISNAKLRLGWGQTGNAGGIAGKSTVALTAVNTGYQFYNLNGGGGATGSFNRVPGFYSPLVDPDLKWETNEQTNIGIDLGFLNGDLTITADYFIRRTKDLLLDRQIRPSAGFTSIYTNYGEIENKGFEFSVNYNKRLSKDWTINAAFNGSTISNKIKKMGADYTSTCGGSNSTYSADDIDGSNIGAISGTGYYWNDHSICREGEAVGSYYGWKVAGVITNQEMLDKAIAQGQNAKMGDFLFQDVAGKVDENGNVVGDGRLDDQDRVILGNGIPKFNYGLNLTATYKNWDFSVYTYGVFGLDILSYSKMRLSIMNPSDDSWTPALLKDSYDNMWSPENPNGTLARLTRVDNNYNSRISDAWVENGNFFKISNVQIGYNVPKTVLNKIGLSAARFYLAVQNLCTISPYTKYGDPEIGQGSVIYTGLDTGRYANPRTFQFGANITFGQKYSKASSAATKVLEKVVEVEKVVEKPVVKEVVKEVVKNNTVQNTYVVTFEVNSYQIANTAELAGIASGSNVEVVAYASPEGNADANIALSQKRADAVADYLKSKGINVTRVEAKGADTEHANRIAIVTVK
ncbi:MAG: SusC/RagA family TonB-linked outer membrane protein [Prevotella sp.]|nr:SusC/RagA family TonB-linked outer membrane protein [Prevotella sp.]